MKNICAILIFYDQNFYRKLFNNIEFIIIYNYAHDFIAYSEVATDNLSVIFSYVWNVIAHFYKRIKMFN